MKNHFLYSALFPIFVGTVLADTIVSGNVSGTWTLNNSPYLIRDNCTVPNGTTLTIEPGVIVIIGDKRSLNVYGQIIAKGTQSQRITFRSPNNNIFWETIYIQHFRQQAISRFEYCDIRNARIGIRLRIGYEASDMMLTTIKYCAFLNCQEYGIYGESFGVTTLSMCCPRSNNPDLNPIIENCIFDGTNNGTVFFIDGDWNGAYQPNSRGKASPRIKRCIYKNLKGYALRLWRGSRPGTSYPIFQNNTVVNCKIGIATEAPFDAEVYNNIFMQDSIAITRRDETTRKVDYNCFYENFIANFQGFPSTYGSIVMENRNGVPCDIGFNIFRDPSFLNKVDFTLAKESSCIDAGNPNSERDPDNTIADIGAISFILPVGINEKFSTPTHFSLWQNHPNPFNPSTTILYELPRASQVEVVIFNLLGEKVRTLLNQSQPAGQHRLLWNGRDENERLVSSGVYFYRLQAGEFAQTKKMILMQ